MVPGQLGNITKVGLEDHGDDDMDDDDNDDYTLCRLVKMWTNFAKRLDPTPEHDSELEFQWDKVERDNHRYLEIGQHLPEMKMEEDYRQRMEFWDQTVIKDWRASHRD